jgi:hypothetical protein
MERYATSRVSPCENQNSLSPGRAEVGRATTSPLSSSEVSRAESGSPVWFGSSALSQKRLPTTAAC